MHQETRPSFSVVSLTEDERGPVGDPSFEALMEDLVEEHDGFTGISNQVQSDSSGLSSLTLQESHVCLFVCELYGL